MVTLGFYTQNQKLEPPWTLTAPELLIMNCHSLGFHPQTNSKVRKLVQQNEQYHMKAVMFSSFQLSGHTLG